MNRRSLLAVGAAGAAAALAGCASVLGSGSDESLDLDLTPGPRQGDSLPADEDPDDGYPPALEEHPPEQSIDASAFGTNTIDGTSVSNAPADASIDVSLAPIQATYYWWARGEARFVDARPPYSYRASHVVGAVSSPANAAIEGTPVADWDPTDRVICYCACPHHLSSIRAAELMRYGFEDVHVIDEGFGKWVQEFEYPIAGQDVSSFPDPRLIEGRADPADAGETAWARHGPTGQAEAGPIAEDGGYELALKFRDVDGDSEVTVETPTYTVTDTLSALTSDVVTG